MAPSFDYGDEPGFLIVADAAEAAAAARDAVKGAGGRVLASVGIAEAEARLAMQTRLDSLIVELADVAEATIGDWLPAVAALASDRRVPVVACVPGSHIDAAWAALGDAAIYVTDPRPLDRVVAVASLRPRGHGGFHDATRDSDERIRQLNAEVARFAERLRQLSGDGERGTDLREPARGYRAEPAGDAATSVEPALVRAVIRARRRCRAISSPIRRGTCCSTSMPRISRTGACRSRACALPRRCRARPRCAGSER